MKTEAQELAEERVRVAARLTAQGRAFARWFPPPVPKARPERDCFEWLEIAKFAPVSGDDQ